MILALGALILDVVRLKEKTIHLDSLADPHEDPVPRYKIIREYSSEFRSYIKRFVRNSLEEAGPQSAPPERVPGTFCCTVRLETFGNAVHISSTSMIASRLLERKLLAQSVLLA